MLLANYSRDAAFQEKWDAKWIAFQCHSYHSTHYPCFPFLTRWCGPLWIWLQCCLFKISQIFNRVIIQELMEDTSWTQNPLSNVIIFTNTFHPVQKFIWIVRDRMGTHTMYTHHMYIYHINSKSYPKNHRGSSNKDCFRLTTQQQSFDPSLYHNKHF